MRSSPARRALAALVVVSALGAAGCSAGGSDESAGGGAGAMAADAAAPRDQTGGTAASGVTDAFLGREVIATAEVTVRTGDVGKARDEVADLLRRYAGHVASERTERDRRGRTVRSVLELRVPTPKFDQALDELEGLAPQVDVDRSTEDVAQQVVDVASRVRTQEISLDRLRGFLDDAATVDDIVRLESEIARREGDLGSLRAQQRQLKDLTAESTITVRLEHEEAAADPRHREGTGFLAGLSTGWDALTAAVVGLSRLAGVLLPFAVVLGLLGVPVVLWLRRRRVVATGPTGEVEPT